MREKTLIVASDTLDVLNTAGPIPTDDLPVQGDCPTHGRVVLDYEGVGHIADDGPDTTSGHAYDCAGECRECPVPVPMDPSYPCGPVESDSPFPFTVAVWQEAHAIHCRCDGRGIVPGPVGGRAVACPASPAGFIVATVEVTGPSHHADECRHEGPGRVVPTSGGMVRFPDERLCRPDAEPDGWHTPTSDVTRLDPPILHERPAFVGITPYPRVDDMDAAGWTARPPVTWRADLTEAADA